MRDVRVDDTVHLPCDPPREGGVRGDDARAAAVDERVRIRAGDDGDAHRAGRPVAEVPPEDIAGVDAHLGRASAALDAVDEEEPVALATQRAGDAVDRLHEPAAVAGRHLQLPLDGLDAVETGGNRACVHHLSAAVLRHPERRRPVLAPAPAAAGEDEREQQDDAVVSRHGVRADRTGRGRADQQPGVLPRTEVGAVHRGDRLLRAHVPLHAGDGAALPASSYAVAV